MSSGAGCRVLVVDDEPGVVSAVRRELLGGTAAPAGITIEGYTSPRLALDAARERHFDAVITDFRMPDIDGLGLLEELAVLRPDCIALVLSGETDLDSLIRMVNRTHIFRFIAKPWRAHHLTASLAEALACRASLLEYRRLANLVRHNGLLALPVPVMQAETVLVVDADGSTPDRIAAWLARGNASPGLLAALPDELAAAWSAAGLLREVAVRVAHSAAAARALLDREDHACVVCDKTLPDGDGTDLLAYALARRPDAARILLADALAKEELTRSIEQARLFWFVAKPLQEFALREAVMQALARRAVERENRQLAELLRPSVPAGGPTAD